MFIKYYHKVFTETCLIQEAFNSQICHGIYGIIYQKSDFYSLTLVKLNFSFQNKKLTLKTINVHSIDPGNSLECLLYVVSYLGEINEIQLCSQRPQSLVRDTNM